MTQAVRLVGGTVFDGTGTPGRPLDVQIRPGAPLALLDPRTPRTEGTTELDARGCWVMPGFIDNHTHYDAELEVSPGLSESVRHGVTTVTIGSCGLGLAAGEPEELADMFCRVEGVPRDRVLPLLERFKDWDTPRAYLEHLDRLALGPNLTVLLGHSTLRAHVMGLARSLDRSVRPSRAELRRMGQVLEDALDAGFLGLSVNTLKWDKMDGERFRSLPTPSTCARWSELRHLNRILRRRDRIWQGVPNISTKLNLLLFLAESSGLGFRKSLKTAVISMVDAKASRPALWLAGTLSHLFNRLLRADFRFQSLPNVFDFWVEGIEVPVFEEFGAGTAALHVKDPAARASLLRDPGYRKRFKREWGSQIWGRAYHRDLRETRIVSCPDHSLEGRSFGEVAERRGLHPVDAFLDLVADHGERLRWYTVLGNDRPAWLRWIVGHPSVQLGFSDAGAHLRNMAHYNFPLRFLKMVHDGHRQGRPPMPIERAIHRLTGEIGAWLGIDAGVLSSGGRADVAVIDPRGLDDEVEALHEAPMKGFEDLNRLVRRNPRAVPAVFVNGRLAARHGEPVPSLGQHAGFGRVLRPTS